MRMTIVPIVLVAIVMGGVGISSPQPRSAAAAIDFANLHDQALSALQALRTSQTIRVASQAGGQAGF